ncbi:MAG: T9SS type A sorting domain-containing protein [Fermentimonas sp.]|nr:T9SS type A sorting domain-containing protein [Fermentimonas sp.]
MKLFSLVLFSLMFTGITSVAAKAGGNNQNSTTGDTVSLQQSSSFQQINTVQDSVIIKLAENRLIIEDLPKDEILEIYNIMGVEVYNRRIYAGTNEYILSLPKGYYILKIGKLTKKIAIR